MSTIRQKLKWILLSSLLLGCIGFGIFYGFITSLVKAEPIRSNAEIQKAVEDNKITGYVYFNNKTEVGRLGSGEERMLTVLSEIPQQMIDATISIEDKSFYTHHGMDVKGTVRAITQQITNENTQTGGSTITQQLSRRVFLSMDQTYERKAAEILLAMRMERVLSKDQILLAYLTKIYFGKGSDGQNLYGIKSAAKGIFNADDLHKLDIAQVAYLAGLPQQPIAYSAFDSKGKLNAAGLAEATKRQKLVLQRMLEEKKISQEEYTNAIDYDIKASLAPIHKKTTQSNPFLMMEVERSATELLLKADQPNIEKSNTDYQKRWDEAREQLLNKGYRVYTTIDPVIYNGMKGIAANKKYYVDNDPVKGVEQIGSIMINNKTGAILGMIEGRDFQVEQMNHATQMVRQPGSAMKPIAAFLPALEAGIIQPASIIDDVPMVLENGSGVHLPENWDGKFHGLITAREALKWSYNIPALKLFNDKVGIPEAWNFVKKLGITTITAQDDQAKTGVIGGLTYGVSVEELTNAYSSIGNQGTYNDSYLIAKIENAMGEVIYEHHVEAKTVFSKQTAFLMTDMMKSVVSGGTAADLKDSFKHYNEVPIVGKTGSTQNDADAWFIGYTPDITVGVWAGYDQPINKLSKSGTARAKKIWAHIMDLSYEKKPNLFPTKEFVMPEDIVTQTVSRYSGKLPTPEIQSRGDVVTDLFNLRYIPTETDHNAGLTKYVSFNGKSYLAQPETPTDMVSEKFMVRREKPISEIMNEIQANLKRVPEEERKSLSHYVPIDADLDEPVEIDPRKDDGNAPNPPVGLSADSANGNTVVTFSLNNEQDVVGYRLYGSNDGNSFAFIQGKPVTSQADAQFTVSAAQDDFYMYAITAVDVAGHESGKSNIQFNDKKSIDQWFSKFFKKRHR
ncbi:MAG: transglycosylase domain-containing protein [Paenibacillaceae bacterium]